MIMDLVLIKIIETFHVDVIHQIVVGTLSEKDLDGESKKI